jgi:putative endonuclease
MESMRLYYVYMLRCFDGTFYVGVSSDIHRRVAEHHHGAFPSCYTYNRRPLRLASVSEFHWIDEAIAFEKRLKNWSHRKKRAFADQQWVELKRFARGPNKTRA